MSGKKAGVIGWPVAHSLSPLLHGHWLQEYGIDGSYEAVAARAEDFTATIERLRGEGFAGVNVTVPHKEAAFALSEKCDAAAESAGAVNLLLFGAPLEGRNTDHLGLQKSLEETLGADALAGKTAVLLGAGGAARGAILALAEMGIAQIHVLNRHQARAESLSHAMALTVKAKLIPGPLSAWASLAPQAGLLLNSSSAGMAGNDPLTLDLSPLPRSAAVCDIVYNPLQTELLKDAATRGHPTVDGLGMLMHQAVPAFEAFFGTRPRITPQLRAVLEQALRAR